jgi:hypothetical protein
VPLDGLLGLGPVGRGPRPPLREDGVEPGRGHGEAREGKERKMVFLLRRHSIDKVRNVSASSLTTFLFFFALSLPLLLNLD